MDAIAFNATDCSFKRSRARVVCERKDRTHHVSASFKRRARAKQTEYAVDTTFAKRQFSLATRPAKGAPPLLEVRVTTPTMLGIVVVNATKCTASAEKVYCVR